MCVRGLCQGCTDVEWVCATEQPVAMTKGTTMTNMTAHQTVEEWSALVTSGEALQEALDLTPCQTLGALFPAIVGEDIVMEALAVLLDPVMDLMAQGVAAGVIHADGAEKVLHDVYHLLQISAGLGHMLGVSDALGMASDLPALDDIAWDDLPDTFGESTPTDTTTGPETAPEDS